MQLFDGHNGSGAATYAKENLLDNVLSAIPSDLTREEWLAALPRALVAGFVKTDKEFQTKGMFGLLNCNFCPLGFEQPLLDSLCALNIAFSINLKPVKLLFLPSWIEFVS